MSVIEKSEILSLVAGSGLPRRRALAQVGLAKSTYYRWLKRQTGGKLQDRKGGSPVPWNKLRPKEEEKIRIVLEGFRRDTPIRDLCRREGIRPSTYYAWLKDFMEAGKDRLTRDITREATRTEIQEMKRENARLKQLVAELSLQVHVLKKTAAPGLE